MTACFGVLAGNAPLPLTRELEAGNLYTTSCTDYRLGRALTAGSGSGSLSGLLGSVDPEVQRQELAAVGDLPPNIGLIHHRITVPVMLELRVRRSLNMRRDASPSSSVEALLSAPSLRCCGPGPPTSASSTGSSRRGGAGRRIVQPMKRRLSGALGDQCQPIGAP